MLHRIDFNFDKLEQLRADVNFNCRKLPTMYWIPKLHKTPYQARFIANSSSCTTTLISKVLTSCFIKVKEHVKRYCYKAYDKFDSPINQNVCHENVALE